MMGSSLGLRIEEGEGDYFYREMLKCHEVAVCDLVEKG
jgi:hypothetical protein